MDCAREQTLDWNKYWICHDHQSPFPRLHGRRRCRGRNHSGGEAGDPRLPDFTVFLGAVAMVLFELLAFARGRGAPGTVVTMDVRVSGFLMAIVLMVVIPIV